MPVGPTLVARKSRTARLPASYRVAVLSRAMAAVYAGYALAAAWAASMSLGFAALGMARTEAVMAATLLAFVVHAIAVTWAFGCKSTRRAWLGLSAPAAALALLAWLLTPGGAA
jgi:hypothetical protein